MKNSPLFLLIFLFVCVFAFPGFLFAEDFPANSAIFERIFTKSFSEPLAFGFGESIKDTPRRTTSQRQPTRPPHVFPENLAPAVSKTQTFSFDVYRELIKDHEDGNLFFSPMSLYFGLSMVAMGAKGETREQMLEVLGMEDFGQAEKRQFLELRKYFSYNTPNMRFFILNQLWNDKSSTVMATYQKDLKDFFGTSITPMDLKKQSEPSRLAINRWVNQVSGGKVRDLLSRGDVHEYTEFILANVMSFKGTWDLKFPKEKTIQRPFYLAKGTSKKVLMMEQTDDFYAYLDDSFQVVSLPYRGLELSMVILLPNKKDGLPALEAELTEELWQQITENMKSSEVNLRMPKFSMDSRLNLKPILERMGMTDAFVFRKADFTDISKSGALFLDFVIQGASVEVNEDGTEAVVVTMIGGGLGGMMEVPKKMNFHADHPFLFIIRDDSSGAILFMGRYVTPPGR